MPAEASDWVKAMRRILLQSCLVEAAAWNLAAQYYRDKSNELMAKAAERSRELVVEVDL